MCKFVAVILSALLVVLFMGCGEQENPVITEDESVATTNVAKIEKADWQIDIVNNQPIVRAADEVIAQDWEGFQTKIAEKITSDDDFESLTILVSGEATLFNAAPQWQVGKYYIRIAWDKHYLGACIGRDAPHLNVTVYDTSGWGTAREIFNAHFAVWRESSWQVCAALWESRSGFCRRLCNPTWQDLQGTWYSAFLAVGISTVMAWWLAQILTSVSVGILVI